MTIQDFAVGLSFALLGFFVWTVAIVSRRQGKFNACLVRCRKRQMDAFEALKAGDGAKVDILMAAAQEELERAEHYIIL